MGAAGHNKGMSDRVGGTVTSYLDRSMQSGLLQITENGTKSSQVIKFCNDTLRWDSKHKLPANFVYPGNSPFASFNIQGHGSTEFQW